MHNVDEKWFYLNDFDEFEKLSFMIAIVAKSTIWEVRGLLRTVRLPDIINSLKVNFKYKLLSQLLTLCHLHNSREQIHIFDQEYTVRNKEYTVRNTLVRDDSQIHCKEHNGTRGQPDTL